MKIIVRELIDRLKESINIKNDSDIANLLDIAQNTLSGAISRNSLKFETFELIHKIIFEYNLSSNWILYGLNDKKIDNYGINFKNEILQELDKLSQKQKEYYYHKIKADALELEIKENH